MKAASMRSRRARERPLVVVVTMKAQLRGRIRRNVTTLLDLGNDVHVLTVDGGKDFLAGLEHPHLTVRYVDVSSVLVWLNQRVRAASARRLAARMALLGGEEMTEYGDGTGGTTLRRLRRTSRWYLRLIRAMYLSRRLPRRSLLVLSRHHARSRRARLSWLRTRLLPWHRVTRWYSFWRRSFHAVLDLSPDLVVSSDLPGLVGASRAARELGVPHLHDCHELYLESSNLRPAERRLLWPVERRYMRRADAVVVVNESIGREYRRRYGVRPVVVRNCAEPRDTDEVVDIRGLAGLPCDVDVVLYQGGFAPGRGLELIIRAASRLPREAFLVLLGDGAYGAELADLALEHGGGRVRFVDSVPPSRLLAVTASATVGVVPYQPVSRNNELALPNKVFEYTVAGVPVVVADIPELRAIAADHGCGVVYDPFDLDDFVRAVSEVLSNGALEKYRQATATYGSLNNWDSERKILVREYQRVSAHLDLVHPGVAVSVSGQRGTER